MSSADYKIFNYQTVTPHYHVRLARDELLRRDLCSASVRGEAEPSLAEALAASFPSETDILIKKSLKGIIKRQ
jgi:hypothetical protein